MQKAVEETTVWLAVDRDFDAVRADPRFQALLEKAGLAGV